MQTQNNSSHPSLSSNDQTTNINTPQTPITHKPTPPPIPSYASLFKENRNLSKCPPLDPNVDEENEETIVALESDLLTVEEAFGYALIGCVVGGNAFPKLLHTLIKTWDVPCTYTSHINGWFLFHFGTKEDMKRVMDNGPYSIMGRQWLLKEIPYLFSFKDSCFESVPLWVNLRYLPKQCWSKPLLSRIAKRIGRPIAMDLVTGEKTKHDGARILVEVNLNKPVVDKVSIAMPNGKIWDQVLEYEIKPVVCSICKGLGHTVEECKPKNPQNNAQRRGRSQARRGRSNVPKVHKENPKGKDGDASILDHTSAQPHQTEKGKECVEDVESPKASNEVKKGWEMVSYKKFGPSISYAAVLLNASSSTLQKSAINTQPIATRPKKIIDDSLPISPNTFGPLFDEDERSPMVEKECAPETSQPRAKVDLKSPKVRVVCEIEEEDVPRNRRLSSSQ